MDKLLSDDWVAYDDSSVDPLRVVSRGTGKGVAAVSVLGRWLRGLCHLGENEVLVGSAPASILRVALLEDRIVSSFQLSDDVNEAVHGLTTLEDE